MNRKLTLVSVAIATLGGCATVPPSGPNVMVLPGSYSSFDQFRQDQSLCEQYAQGSTGPVAQTASNNAVNSAMTGAALGAAAGAIIGAASHDADEGAAAGAGLGLLAGSAAGLASYNTTASELQDRYDAAYVQCMYAKGHQVPVPAGYTSAPARAAPPAPANYPPPPGYSLPPPPHS